MYELYYWCPSRQLWLRVEGSDYPDADSASEAAYLTAQRSARTIEARDSWTGQILCRYSP